MKLRRSADDRMIAGVCGGIARAIEVPSNYVRIAFAVLVLFFGLSALTYALAWIFVPSEA
jgi:phage shock protein C